MKPDSSTSKSSKGTGTSGTSGTSGTPGHILSLKPGDVVFDVGSNIGLFTLHCLGLTGGDLQIHVFEPIPVLADICEANVKRYATEKTVYSVNVCGLTRRCVGGGCQEEQAQFRFFPEYSLISSQYEWTDAEKEDIAVEAGGEAAEITKSDLAMCKMTTLSDVLKTKSIDRIDLLKIDVEKAELDVLLGIDDSDWEKIQQIVIEVHAIDDRLDVVRDLLVTKRFSCVEAGPLSTLEYPCYKYGESSSKRASPLVKLCTLRAARSSCAPLSTDRHFSLSTEDVLVAPPMPDAMYPAMGAAYGHDGHDGQACEGVSCSVCYKYSCQTCGARSNFMLVPCRRCAACGP